LGHGQKKRAERLARDPLSGIFPGLGQQGNGISRATWCKATGSGESSTMVSMIVVGAGSRGAGYAEYATHHPEQARIVAVAEPRAAYREPLARAHNIPAADVVEDWPELARRDRFADAVIIATPDAHHAEPAIAFARRGYHILLEKPMAPSEAECRRIVAEVKKAGVHFAVCHVLRYTRYTEKLKALLDAGAVGEIVSVNHLEPVGYWHQAHSFVRGNWRNEAESTFMLLAKSCHDLDWLRYLVGKRCVATSSFGSLKHFRKENQPDGAADHCLDCRVEEQCPYSAKRLYLQMLDKGHTGWPLDVVTPDVNETSVLNALRDGPYGRCVYACDNDVVDHQVVNMRFEGDATAAFTMTAFNRGGPRETMIFGTHGELRGDGARIKHFDFVTRETHEYETESSDGTILSGHGGGDLGIMKRFVAAVANDDPSQILSGPDETLESHLMVFAAEQARREDRVVHLDGARS
jgi:predicted dehydrogenase